MSQAKNQKVSIRVPQKLIADFDGKLKNSIDGIQSKRTAQPVKKVAQPKVSPVFKLKPCAKTVHGAFPILDCTTNASPIPKIVSPKNNIRTRLNERSHRCFARQGVCGTVLCGFRWIRISFKPVGRCIGGVYSHLNCKDRLFFDLCLLDLVQQ